MDVRISLCAVSVAASATGWLLVQRSPAQAPRERIWAAVKNIFRAPRSKGGPAKNLYTKSERLTVSCRVTWAWSDRVNFYNQQIMILPRETTYATLSGPGPGNLYRLLPFSSALAVLCVCVCLIVCDLETSTKRLPRPDIGCCATEKKRITTTRLGAFL
jgi:hypothetical protein